DNFIIQNDLGVALGQRGRLAEAVPHLDEALRLRPDYMAAGMNLIYALRLFVKERKSDSLDAGVLGDAFFRAGLYLETRQDLEHAEECMRRALRARPGWAPAEPELAKI